MLGQDRLERARRGEWGALNERRGWIPETEILKLLLDFFLGRSGGWWVEGWLVPLVSEVRHLFSRYPDFRGFWLVNFSRAELWDGDDDGLLNRPHALFY
jgi:hypothetical protein